MKPVTAFLCASIAATSILAPALAAENWADASQTPGDWRLALLPTGSTATYRAPDGSALFTLTCTLKDRSIALTRHTAPSAQPLLQGLMQVHTQTRERVLTVNGDDSAIGASLPASDPLFDAMAISRGRFAVEVEGSEPLYLPAWPEVTRVIEDCR